MVQTTPRKWIVKSDQRFTGDLRFLKTNGYIYEISGSHKNVSRHSLVYSSADTITSGMFSQDADDLQQNVRASAEGLFTKLAFRKAKYVISIITCPHLLSVCIFYLGKVNH